MYKAVVPLGGSMFDNLPSYAYKSGYEVKKGGLITNPHCMGAIQLNPHCMGAIQVNPHCMNGVALGSDATAEEKQKALENTGKFGLGSLVCLGIVVYCISKMEK